MRTVSGISPEMLLNEVIRLYPPSVEVFQRYGLDACCGGARSLADAARAHGVELDELVRELEEVSRLG